LSTILIGCITVIGRFLWAGSTTLHHSLELLCLPEEEKISKKMKSVSVLALCLALMAVCASAAPTFSVRRLNNQRPILTEKDSVWLYNYNTAYMPVRPSILPLRLMT
jgi:hypothetical protein